MSSLLTETEMPGPRELPKRSSACAQCRARKVKCDGITPCSRCSNHGAQCIYPESRRGKRKRDAGQDPSVEDRVAQMEAFIRTHAATRRTPDSGAHYNVENSYNILPPIDSSNGAQFRSAQATFGRQGTSDLGDMMRTPLRSPCVTTDTLVPSHRDLPTPVSQISSTTLERGIQSSAASHDDPKGGHGSFVTDKEGSILEPQSVNWEHHGPGSWFSVCSKPGVTWVSQRTGVNDFAKSARELTSTWTQRLKMDRSKVRPSVYHTEPDPETAWKYTAAYFEESLESSFGVVHRPDFENALRASFRGDSTGDDSIAWYALRQTVLAAGCRIYMSRDPSKTFEDVQNEAWRYFQEALSVLNELIFTPTGLLAVRALVAMTYFAEGLGCPALEYMLCTNAARLAQSKGLHRQPAKSWNLAASDVLHHNWLFWSVYCCEKYIAQRSGRPSAIDDDDISCQIPTEICPGSTIDVEAFTSIIRHAQISSQISKRLMSVKAFQQSPSTLLTTAVELHRKLQDWKASVPAELRPLDHLRSFRVSQNAKPLPTILIHCAYYGSLMAVHTVFAYPWISFAIFGNDPSTEIQNQILSSSNTIADAARNIILIAKTTEITGASTQWSTFYYPMIGLINLFIHVLRYPNASSVRSDLALLDVAAGYFGHMEFVTAAELSFPFARDIATLARKTYDKFALHEPPTTSKSHETNNFEQSTPFPFEGVFHEDGDLNFDDWSIFSSVLMDEISEYH